MLTFVYVYICVYVYTWLYFLKFFSLYVTYNCSVFGIVKVWKYELTWLKFLIPSGEFQTFSFYVPCLFIVKLFPKFLIF